MRRKIRLCACAGCAAIGWGSDAGAQTTLPEIVVTTPSPLVRTQLVPQSEAHPVDAPQDVYPVVGNAFSPITLVPSSQILRTPGATLGDTLFAAPGVTGNTFGPGASRPVIRGLDNARVRVQENGIGVGDVSTISEDHAVPIDPLTTERLEVIRGPATLRWGPQAIGGVVAAINNRIPDPMTPAGFSLVTRSALSSVDRGREGAVIVEGRAPNFAVHADYARRSAGDYRIPGGIQPNTFVDSESMAAGGSYFYPDGYFGVAVAHFNSLYGIPGVEAAESRTRIDLKQTKIMSKGEVRTHGTLVDTIRFWLGGAFYKHDERALDDGVDTVKATFRNKEFEGRTEMQFVPVPTGAGILNVAVGVQGGFQSLGTSGEAGSLLAPSETTRFASYIFSELSLSDTLRLQGAARLGVQNVRGTAAQFPVDLLPNGQPVTEAAVRRTFVPGSASFGVLKDLPFGLVASGTVSDSERAPKAQELFSKGPHEASGTFEIGLPTLRKEAATSFELGLKRPHGDFRFEATAFHTRYSGFIYKRLTGNSCGEEFDTCTAGFGEELKQVAFDQKAATFTGFEFAGQIDLASVAGGTFGLDGQFDVVRARFMDGANVPRIPPVRIGGGLYWRNANWFARVGLLHAFAQNLVAQEETATPGYNLLKAELSYTRHFRPSDVLRSMTVGVVGTNLLDDPVRNHVSFKKDEVLLAGRGVRFFATTRF